MLPLPLSTSKQPLPHQFSLRSMLPVLLPWLLDPPSFDYFHTITNVSALYRHRSATVATPTIQMPSPTLSSLVIATPPVVASTLPTPTLTLPSFILIDQPSPASTLLTQSPTLPPLAATNEPVITPYTLNVDIDIISPCSRFGLSPIVASNPPAFAAPTRSVRSNRFTGFWLKAGS
ncbi:hypothetical protein IHE45_03G037000 [Dioscorea alata]|uniref:Uncharacterized protein n=1 Tax=Dioscorea alata TaxID=55571 RepID=A0ACB7WKL3_DIOAL|nr:hypothetical protein IHE45_03G037000 [Dioscorea alata]